MSCSKKPCANTYSNYGSYLRTRGCESAICRLLEDIKSGLIPIGPINPSVPCNLVINSNVTIQPCLEEPFRSGKLIVSGGYVTPCSSDTTPLIQSIEAQNYSITAGKGLYVEGPIFANATVHDCPHNTFIANTTLFTGNNDTHNVTITGSSIIGSAIITDGDPILTCGDDTLFNVNFASASEDLILDIDSNKFKVYKSNTSPNDDDEEPILRINKNYTVYNALSTPMMSIDDGGRKIFEVICNLNADVNGDDSMPGFVVKESNFDYTNIDYLNNANIYMHHLPKVEPNFLYPRVVVHPETGRLYKEYQYFPDTYIIDTLTVRDDLKVGAKFEVISDKDISSDLVVRMNNLPDTTDEEVYHPRVVVNPLTGRLYKDTTDTLNNLTVDTLDVRGQAIVGTLDVSGAATADTLDVSGQAIVGTLDVSGKAKADILDVSGKAIVESLNVGLEFGVTRSTGDGDTLLVRMNNLPDDQSISIAHKVLVINEKGEVETSSQDSLLASLDAKITALHARIIELENNS